MLNNCDKSQRDNGKAYPLEGPRFCGVRENWQIIFDFLQDVHDDISFSVVASHRIWTF